MKATIKDARKLWVDLQNRYECYCAVELQFGGLHDGELKECVHVYVSKLPERMKIPGRFVSPKTGGFVLSKTYEVLEDARAELL